MLHQFTRFVGVGIIAAIIHYSTLIALTESGATDPVTGSAIGYIISGIANYFLSHRFTFRSSEKHRISSVKFTIVALLGLALNTTFMYIFVYMINIDYLVSQVLTMGLVLLSNFHFNRSWTFQSSSISKGSRS